MKALSHNEQGFTLVELISVIVVTSIFVGLISLFMFNFWRAGYLQEADLDTFVSRLNAGDYVRNTVGESSGLIIQNSLTDLHVEDPDPSQASGDYWVPIHAIPTTVAIGSNGTYTPLIYFRHYSQDSSGNYIMNGSQPYEDEYIFYLDGTTKELMSRILANPNASGNRLKTTCPPASATLSCPADKVIAENVASVATRYFSRAGNTIDYTSVWDPDTNSYAGPDFPSVDVVEFTLNLTYKPVFQTTNATVNATVIRVALRNS